MRLHSFGIERRLEDEIVHTLEDQQRPGDHESRMPHAHALDRRDDAHEDRDHAADQRPGVRHDVHHTHDKADEPRVGGLHPEGHHHQRHGDREQQAFRKDTRKVARQQDRHRIQRTGDVAVIMFRENGGDHRVEQALLLEEEEGDERNGENGDHRRKHEVDDRRENRVERIDVDDLPEGGRQFVGFFAFVPTVSA